MYGDAGQTLSPVSHEGDGVIQKIGHGREVVGLKPGEQGSARTSPHPALRIDGPSLYGSVGNRGAETSRYGPHDGAFARRR
jgi:hypothetical protein